MWVASERSFKTGRKVTINTTLATLGDFYTPIRPRTLNAARLDLPKRARARDSVRSLRAVEG